MTFAEFASPEFDEFLDLIGSRVQLKGFQQYRGGLDVKSKYRVYMRFVDFQMHFCSFWAEIILYCCCYYYYFFWFLFTGSFLAITLG